MFFMLPTSHRDALLVICKFRRGCCLSQRLVARASILFGGLADPSESEPRDITDGYAQWKLPSWRAAELHTRSGCPSLLSNQISCTQDAYSDINILQFPRYPANVSIFQSRIVSKVRGLQVSRSIKCDLSPSGGSSTKGSSHSFQWKS